MSNTKAAHWTSDPLLARAPTRTPQFVRLHWDEPSTQAFGPWRLQEKNDPTQNLTTPPHAFAPDKAPSAADSPDETDDSATAAAPADPHASSPDEDLPPATHTEASGAGDAAHAAAAGPGPGGGGAVGTGFSEQHLKVARQQGYVQGIKDGVAKTLGDLEVEREKEREAMRALSIELHALTQDSERFYEPVRRLALHIAEQLVRGELSVSEQAIDRLVKSALTDVGNHDKPVVVNLHPDDLHRLQMADLVPNETLRFEPDPKLFPGSVRVRANDTEIQDFIEHRLEALARRLLSQPEAWLSQSTLVNKVSVQEMPDHTPERPWRRQPVDIQDTQEKPHQVDVQTPQAQAQPQPVPAAEPTPQASPEWPPAVTQDEPPEDVKP